MVVLVGFPGLVWSICLHVGRDVVWEVNLPGSLPDGGHQRGYAGGPSVGLMGS